MHFEQCEVDILYQVLQEHTEGESWVSILKKYNSQVPEKRKRSSSSLQGKCRLMGFKIPGRQKRKCKERQRSDRSAERSQETNHADTPLWQQNVSEQFLNSLAPFVSLPQHYIQPVGYHH